MATDTAVLEQSARGAERTFTQEESFVLRVVQPALVGLMDGSVSTVTELYICTGSVRRSGACRK